MDKLFNIWPITSFDEYKDQWPAIPGKFEKLTDYQKSLGYKTTQEFFEKQAYAAQNLANDRVGNILERVFSTSDLTEPVRIQLKKFTYQTIDFLRMNDLVISEDVRVNQTSFNNNRTDNSQVNIDRIEQYVGSMAWRSWILANIQKLYISWAKENDLPFLLDPKHFYNKEEIDYKLALIDDQIQMQQKLIDEKLEEFNRYIDEHLEEFKQDLKSDEEFLKNIGSSLIENDGFISSVADKLSESVVTKQYVDDQDQIILKDSKEFTDSQIKLVNEKMDLKQDTLIAGKNIIIDENNVISSPNKDEWEELDTSDYIPPYDDEGNLNENYVPKYDFISGKDEIFKYDFKIVISNLNKIRWPEKEYLLKKEYLNKNNTLQIEDSIFTSFFTADLKIKYYDWGMIEINFGDLYLSSSILIDGESFRVLRIEERESQKIWAPQVLKLFRKRRKDGE